MFTYICDVINYTLNKGTAMMTSLTTKISECQASQGVKNGMFMWTIDSEVFEAILENIAGHYAITKAEAFDEITHDEAENLLDYVTGKERAAVSVLAQKYGLV